jgi:hypothetical protein
MLLSMLSTKLFDVATMIALYMAAIACIWAHAFFWRAIRPVDTSVAPDRPGVDR